ncbi:unnamed protein product [Rotaria sp. Silwood2]|nr:unnamed protein product [Rotaria sp. Silwood2]CAF2893141.1 unnamed protein product [Rotaria sp. Silwood2]CAF3444964.1 unnamed protein product [Rotaria sp. Silwood2]CAF4379083.1 unnamed protein product [Rotaria sp. Silwood2]CAF4385375.1 unnamed protein product [Rotaria sp. Silwood2]
MAIFDFTSVAASQQQNHLNKGQLNFLSENSIEISLHKKNDDRLALIEGTDNDFGASFIEIEMHELNLHSCIVLMICLLKHLEVNDII